MMTAVPPVEGPLAGLMPVTVGAMLNVAVPLAPLA